MEWQPIETAPFGIVKLGKWINASGKDLWVSDFGRVWEWQDGPWPWSKPVKEKTFDGTYYTHWMPLPLPPPPPPESK